MKPTKQESLLLQGVAPSVLERVTHYADAFSSASPFKHVVIDDFLRDEFCDELLAQFPSFDEKLAIDENGNVGRKAVREKLPELGGPYEQLDQLIRGTEFLKLISSITGIADLVYDPHYFGGGTHENLSGQSLDPHIDFNHHPITDHHRRLNLIVYLNREWRYEWGGTLDLHRDPYGKAESDEVVSVLPTFNRCVIFETTEHSWHGFETVRIPDKEEIRSRKSIALYYYTEHRPVAHTGPHHSTVYVNRRLPGHISAGTTLSEQDFQTIASAIDVRDVHLKRLYRDIAKLSEQLHQARQRLESWSLPDASLAETNSQLLAAHVWQLENQLREIRESKSWRLTRPLRNLRRRVVGHAKKSNRAPAPEGTRPCPIAGVAGTESRWVGPVFPTHSASFSVDEFHLIYSESADIVYLSPLPNADDLRLLYEDSGQFSSQEYVDQDRIRSMDEYYSQCAERYFPALRNDEFRLLEVGAGMAWVSKSVKNLNPAAHADAQDVSGECQHQAPWVDNYHVEALEPFLAARPACYDAISLTHVIEHLPDPADAIGRLCAALKPGGALFLTGPYRPRNWNPGDGLEAWLDYSYLHVPAHITYLSERALRLVARSIGAELAHWDQTADGGEAFECVLTVAR